MENPLKRRRTDDERPTDRDKPKPDRQNGETPKLETKQPKKGSFAELMSRAKAQAKPSTVGMYQHKVTKALTKREIRLERARQAAAAQPVKTQRPGFEPRAGQAVKARPVKPAVKKPPPKMEYSGTSYRGPFKVERPPAHEERPRYESESEEDYESDASSDMEATGFEVEEEELRSARQAKREDEEAERLELEHQRQKALRKKKMAELAKRRKV